MACQKKEIANQLNFNPFILHHNGKVHFLTVVHTLTLHGLMPEKLLKRTVKICKP